MLDPPPSHTDEDKGLARLTRLSYAAHIQLKIKAERVECNHVRMLVIVYDISHMQLCVQLIPLLFFI